MGRPFVVSLVLPLHARSAIYVPSGMIGKVMRSSGEEAKLKDGKAPWPPLIRIASITRCLRETASSRVRDHERMTVFNPGIFGKTN